MKREQYLKEIERNFEVHAVCALLGPRQVGKTTLARMYTEELFDGEATFFDLENERDLARLENPYLTFSLIKTKLIVIDEIQLRPDLFKVLRVVVDDPKNTARFLILGSAVSGAGVGAAAAAGAGFFFMAMMTQNPCSVTWLSSIEASSFRILP